VGRAADALTGYQEAGGEDHRWRELFAAVDRSNGP